MKKLLPLILFCFPFILHAQIDNEFWFAPPDLTKGYPGEPRRDSTVYLVFTTLSNASEVKIWQPANLSFDPIIITIPAHSTEVVDLGLFLSQIETKPANQVLNTGILIRSTYPLTAYYEVRGSNNSDIFALKGKNALGKKFYVPFQTEFQNNQVLGNHLYVPPPRSGFVIVASDDSTTVSITPTTDIVGHLAGETFTIELNRGQTFSCEASGWEAGSQPAGSLIESDKEIAVTIKDDMLDMDPITGSTWADIAGDQIIPVEYLGKTYIVVRGDLATNTDRVIICATEDNTDIYIDGTTTPVTIDAGEQYIHQFNGPSAYFESTKKIAVLQITGVDEQLAGAVIPALDCTGSTKVGFVKGRNRPFFMTLMIRAGGEDGFILNGDPTLISASDFAPVVGTGGYYVFARIEFSNAEVPFNQASLVENNSGEVFHMGITNGSSNTSCNFGFFSSFNFLNIGTNSSVCLGDSLKLDAGPGKTAYLWSTGDTTQAIMVYEPGTYYVDAYFGSDCIGTDTIEVTYYEPPIDLGPNDTICAGTTLDLDVTGNYLFMWQDGSTENSYTVSDSGYYWVDITDFQGCISRDSIRIDISPRPETPDLTGETQYCQGDDIQLFMNEFDSAYYRYILPSGNIVSGQDLVISDAQPSNSGTYYGYYVVDGCETFTDSIDVVVHPLPEVSLGANVTVCTGTDVTLSPSGSDGAYQWQDGSEGQTFTPTSSGTYYVTLTDANMCSTADTIEVTFKPIPESPVIAGNDSYCVGETIALTTEPQTGANFNWINPDGETSSPGSAFSYENATISQSGQYSVFVELDGCLSDTAYFELMVHANPVLNLAADTTICDNATIQLSGPDGFTYAWTSGEDTQTIETEAATVGLTITDPFGCTAYDEIMISTHGPEVGMAILPDHIGQPGSDFTFEGSSTAQSTLIAEWIWNFGDGSTADAQNTIHGYAAEGVYEVILNATDEFGCQTTVSDDVIVRYDFKIPDGFSPNGDGINDNFEIQGLTAFSDVTIKIFNRWGAVVYESSHYGSEKYWDGGDCTDGTYFYVLKMPGMDAKSGSVTLSR